jgi:hypothetical protein
MAREIVMTGNHVAICAMFAVCSSAVAGTLTVPSDPDAQYSIISVSETDAGLEVITQREGISGFSYSKREFDCANRKVLFMGSSTSVADLENVKADDEATPWFKGSLGRAISDVVCRDTVAAANQ